MSLYLQKIEPTEKNPFRYSVTDQGHGMKFDAPKTAEDVNTVFWKMLSSEKLDKAECASAVVMKLCSAQSITASIFDCAFNYCDIVSAAKTSLDKRRLAAHLTKLSALSGSKLIQDLITASRKELLTPQGSPEKEALDKIADSLSRDLRRLSLTGNIVSKIDDGTQGVYLLQQTIAKTLTPQAKEEEAWFCKLYELFGNDRVLPAAEVQKIEGEILDPSSFLKDLVLEKTVVAKRKVNGLIDMEKIHTERLKALLQSLSPDCQVALLLTTVFQSLDYHVGNIGFELADSAETNPYMKYEYRVGDSTLTIHQLAERYLRKDIDPSAQDICVGNPGTPTLKIFQGKMDGCARLMETIQRWKLAIYDADRCMAESNAFQYLVELSDLSTYHLFALRSSLFDTEWAVRPILPEIQTKLFAKEMQKKVVAWIDQTDSGILSKLEPDLQAGILQRIHGYISHPKYSLAHTRYEDTLIRGTTRMTPWSEIATKIAKELADIRQNKEFWESMQKCTYDARQETYTVKLGQTMEDIAQEVQKRVQDLCVINCLFPIPKGIELRLGKLVNGVDTYITGDNETVATVCKRCGITPVTVFNLNTLALLKKGVKLRLHIEDLTGSDPTAQSERVMIASQCIPKMSWFQRRALVERFSNLNTYMEDFQRLLGQNILTRTQLKTIVGHASTPLSTPQRNAWVLDIDNASKTEQSLQAALCAAIRPSFTTVSQSMYPLLADCMLVNRYVYKTEHYPFELIGHHLYSIEKIVLDFLKIPAVKDHQSMEIQLLCGALQEEISENNDNVDIAKVLPRFESIVKRLHDDLILEKDLHAVLVSLHRLLTAIEAEKKAHRHFSAPVSLKQAPVKTEERKKS